MNRLKGRLLKNNKLSVLVLSVWTIIALFAPYLTISVEKPFTDRNKLINYSPEEMDFKNAPFVGPFDDQKLIKDQDRHLLGTDEIGRDLLSMMIHGASTAFIVSLFSVLLASLIGIIVGSVAGFYADNTISVSRTAFIMYLFLSIWWLTYTLLVFPFSEFFKNAAFLPIVILFSAILGSYLVMSFLTQRSKSNKSFILPIDLIIGRLIEFMESIPLLFVIIAIGAIFKPSYFTLIGLIGFTAWPAIAKLCRAEVLKAKEKQYAESAKALGFSGRKILFDHILPNSLGPVMVNIAFGFGSVILLESTLSFLGLGFGPDQASWGSIMASAVKNPEAWWLAVFPGLAIFLIVYSCNKIGRSIQ